MQQQYLYTYIYIFFTFVPEELETEQLSLVYYNSHNVAHCHKLFPKPLCKHGILLYTNSLTKFSFLTSSYRLTSHNNLSSMEVARV